MLSTAPAERSSRSRRDQGAVPRLGGGRAARPGVPAHVLGLVRLRGGAPVLIAPVLSSGYGPGLRCEICRVGSACAVVMHSRGHFLVCHACCGNVAAAILVRVAFAHDVTDLSVVDPERLA